MLRARLDTRMSNEALTDGTLSKLMQSITELLHPEAAYFGPGEGGRTCTFVFDMQDSSMMPRLVEPLFQRLGASIEIQPVMNSEELHRGLAAVQQDRTVAA